MNPKPEKLEQFFKIVSYSVALCGLLALYVSGGVGVIAAGFFLAAATVAWFIEDTKWQLGSRAGVALIFVVVPLFYLDWKYKIVGTVGEGLFAAGSLARLILFLGAVKLLQKKSDRDWIFVYLIAFFQVLLAAGLSISPLYLATLFLFLLTTVCAFILFEMQKTSREVFAKNNSRKTLTTPLRKLPFIAFTILILIAFLAVPLFFTFPRFGGAGMAASNAAGNRITGFSDSVRLGEIGRLLQSDEIVMRVRLENAGGAENLRWRGTALDFFDRRGWNKSVNQKFLPLSQSQNNVFVLNTTTEPNRLIEQTVYLEPLQTPVIFTLSDPVLVQGNFRYVRKDAEDSVIADVPGFERTSYKALSDPAKPDAEILKKDEGFYDENYSRYLQLPDEMDARIERLAAEITENQPSKYEKARAIEKYLQTRFGYTLDLKAGGDEPLADFLFNVREGHCEYFATAMAVMLRTQGVASRVVNGFQAGEYNETADAYIVRQNDAHSWVEVYFPESGEWITFDPTPFAGRNPVAENAGIFGSFNNYIEAIETFWIQYFVAYDNQEQRTLFRSVKSGFVDYQAKASVLLDQIQREVTRWWQEVRGDKGLQASAWAIVKGAGILLGATIIIFILIWSYRRIRNAQFWQKLLVFFNHEKEPEIVKFYERMQNLLEKKGYRREPSQTPLEFALALKMPEILKVTEKYNLVRYGKKDLSQTEAEEIEIWLEKLENNP